MIKGILLGVCFAVFTASLIVIFSGSTGRLQENLITGAAVSQGAVFSYAFLSLFISFILGIFILVIMLKPKQEQ